jgi:hypothetical protein
MITLIVPVERETTSLVKFWSRGERPRLRQGPECHQLHVKFVEQLRYVVEYEAQPKGNGRHLLQYTLQFAPK